MLMCWMAALITLQATAVTLPAKPEYNHYVVDDAGLLDVYSEHVIDSIGALRSAEGRPLYVVTVDSAPSGEGAPDGLQGYARAIYDGWQIGANARPNRGVLLVISSVAGRSAIVYGPGWGSLHDADAARLTRDIFDPALGSDAPSDAVTAGVRQLAATVASRNAWWGRGIAMIPVIAILLAWLSYGRIRSRSARREAERAAVFASVATQMATRRYDALRAAGEGKQRPISPSDPPS